MDWQVASIVSMAPVTKYSFILRKGKSNPPTKKHGISFPPDPLQLCACVVHLRPLVLSTKHHHHWTLIDLHSPTWLHSFRCSSATNCHKIPSVWSCRSSTPEKIHCLINECFFQLKSSRNCQPLRHGRQTSSSSRLNPFKAKKTTRKTMTPKKEEKTAGKKRCIVISPSFNSNFNTTLSSSPHSSGFDS